MYTCVYTPGDSGFDSFFKYFLSHYVRICFQYMRNEMANDYALSIDSLEVCSL